MFRLGAISDEVSPNAQRALDLVQAWGLSDVEVHTVWDKNIEELTNLEVRRLRQQLDEHGLRTCCISSTVFLHCSLDDPTAPIEWPTRFHSIGGTYPEHVQALARCLEIAAMLDAPLVRIFGFWRAGPTNEVVYAQAAQRLQKPLDMAGSAGIRLALENCPHTYFDWGQRAARLVDLINSPWLGLLWDPCSSLRSGQTDYLAGYASFRQRIVHVHAKDMRFDSGAQHDRVYVPIGRGEIDWREIIQRLARDSYAGVISLETHHLAIDGRQEPAAAASFNALRQIVDEC